MNEVPPWSDSGELDLRPGGRRVEIPQGADAVGSAVARRAGGPRCFWWSAAHMACVDSGRSTERDRRGGNLAVPALLLRCGARARVHTREVSSLQREVARYRVWLLAGQGSL